MPYEKGTRLPGERASKLWHLDVIQSDLVQKLVKKFEDDNYPSIPNNISWQELPPLEKPLSFVFAVDGSIQTIEYPTPPYKRIAFVKTALLRMHEYELSKIDKESPHPLALRDILSDCTLYHATVFPLRHIT
ncbi:MAG: hypothetical protein DRP02_13650, partial [Candidatus Gerdarchaeota archaeon]